MESHAVHIHMKCEDMNQAVQCENGIAVVGNFLQVTKDDNNDLLAITNNLKKVIKTNSEAEISADCFQWLQNNSENEYYTYPGSLTTPPKSKTVTWIVFPNPIHISHSQVKCFRQLTNEEDH
ncbi:AAEL005520-PA, partial [Gryllus bimaculatus]